MCLHTIFIGDRKRGFKLLMQSSWDNYQLKFNADKTKIVVTGSKIDMAYYKETGLLMERELKWLRIMIILVSSCLAW